jgi:predicted RNA-binding protein with PIN domain
MYTGQGESADDAIKRIIAQERREWIVISSDRSIEQHAWSHGSIPVSSARFEAILDRVSATAFDAESVGFGEASGEGDDAGESAERPSSGNPHRPSKKDRALQRALRKLESVVREH